MKFHVCILFQSSVVPFVIPALTCLLFVSFIFTKCFTGLLQNKNRTKVNVFKLDLYFLQTGENSTIASIYCNGISDYCDDKQLYLGNHDIMHRIKFLWKLLVFSLPFSSHLPSLLSLCAFPCQPTQQRWWHFRCQSPPRFFRQICVIICLAQGRLLKLVCA